MIATVLIGDICDECKHKSSQTLYSATCTYGHNKGKQCLNVSSCINYKKVCNE